MWKIVRHYEQLIRYIPTIFYLFVKKNVTIISLSTVIIDLDIDKLVCAVIG